MPVTVKRNVKRSQMWARVFLHGPSGSGKTRGAFELASRIFGGLPTALINTEPNRGELYADRYPLEALIDLEGDYHPERFIEALDAAEQIVRGGVIILDSATHEWYGTNGVTQLAGRINDWTKVRPLHQKFVDRIQVAQTHIIVCCRSKMKYDIAEIEEGGRKKQVVTALGVGPMQDADFQYEFSLAGSFDRASHDVEWTGHVDALEGKVTNLVSDEGETASVLTAWLAEGTPIEPIQIADEAEVAKLREALKAEAVTADKIERGFEAARKLNRGQLHPDWVAEKLADAATRREAKAAAKANEPAAEGEPATA